MVAIPTRAPMSAPRTPVANGRLAQTGDLGLSAVGDALSRTARGMANTADRAAAQTFDQTQNEFDAGYLPAAQTYDGRAPGFAREQMARFDGMTAAAAEAIGDPDARRAFERMRPQRRAAQFEAAIRVESQRSGERQREATERTTSLDALNRVAALRVSYAARKKELLDSYDGAEGGLADRTLAALDEEIARSIEGAPEGVRERLTIQTAALRGDEWMALQTIEGRARDAHEATTATKTAEALISAVVSDPGQYDAAVRDAAQLGAELPATLQRQMIQETTRSLATARFEGLLRNGGWESVLTELDGGSWDEELGAEAKSALRDNAVRYRAAAGFDPVSNERAMAQASTEERVRSHLASLQTTGQGSGLTAADVTAVGGPAAGAAFARQEETARLAYSVTRGLAGLPLAEQAARVESLKPQGGEADFADRQAAYETALQTMTAARTLQVTDPATATQASEASAGLWRAYQGAPTTANAQAWANDTLRRQAANGVAAGQQRILPLSEARRVAGMVKDAEGPDTLTALQAASALVGTFGGHEGRILTELTRAGLTAQDAAVIGQAGDNPLALSDYARARARGNPGLTPTVARQARAETVSAVRDLVETWAALPGGQAGADGLISGIAVVAAAKVADGMTPREAAREAARPYLDAYRFEGGWRMPRALAEGRAPIRGNDWTGRTGSVRQARTIDAVNEGGRRFIRRIVLGDGAQLAPIGSETSLTDEQKRARYADRIASGGRWVSTLSDDGLMLTVPDASRPGGVIPVMGASGRPIVMTWADLLYQADQDPPERDTWNSPRRTVTR